MDQDLNLFLPLILNIGLLIGVVILFVNVAKIKNSVSKSSEFWTDQFWKHYHFGENEKAFEALKELTWTEIRIIYKDEFVQSERQRRVEVLKNKYKSMFEKIGKTFPETPE
ncbi:hypothetical protein [Cecembia rubra]|uniref:Uncharacterized protein n=1 Tax=Cecembia rubra TaxID=1485585 RepID=A0A2P8E336_9BACT|nr:hypothetical protein [Cecembia rubra]PSL03889.1 hypothetical protein CLV48_106129 [Cecembia rubra]